MKWIYQEAEHVIIWLGNYNEPGDNALRLDFNKWKIDRIEPNSEAIARSALVPALFLKQEASRKQKSEVSIGIEDCNYLQNLQAWAQLMRLFHRPWFERLWVIQELAVSRKAVVAWGKLRTHWRTLEKAAKFILRPGETLIPPQIRQIFPLVGAHRITQVDLQSMFNVDIGNILTILHNTQSTKCSDPRDRLYAILGIVDDTKDIDIDYTIPVQQVYRNWAEKRIKRTQTLDILSACADSSRGGDLPSWVPDLRRPFGKDKALWIESQTWRNEAETRLKENRRSRSREGKDPWEFHCRGLAFAEDGLKLSVSGQYEGEIVNLTTVGDVVTDLLDPTDLDSRLRQIIGDWERTLEETGEPRTPGDIKSLTGFEETLLREFHITWSSYRIKYDLWRPGESRLASYFDRFGSEGRDYSAHEAKMRELERALFPRVHGCQMFTTEEERTGIVAGNCGTQIGDEIWLLSGGLTAFLLRRVNEVEHRLISPCYLSSMFSLPDYDSSKKVILV
jgi:hypothetical protein